METIIFQLIVFLFSVIIHEISHGYVAERLGDPTARLAGRLTLNPISHLDPVGSVFLPLMLVLLNSPFVFGWAKPVPYDPRNLKDPRTGGGLIAAAGPASNLFLALIFGLLIRLNFAPQLIPLFGTVVIINIFLALFNLLPIPPLDGSKVLFALLPDSPVVRSAAAITERYGFLILLLVIFTGAFRIIFPLVAYLTKLFAGGGTGIF